MRGQSPRLASETMAGGAELRRSAEGRMEREGRLGNSRDSREVVADRHPMLPRLIDSKQTRKRSRSRVVTGLSADARSQLVHNSTWRKCYLRMMRRVLYVDRESVINVSVVASSSVMMLIDDEEEEEKEMNNDDDGGCK